MQVEKIKQALKQNDKVKDFVLFLMSPRRNPKPRLWVKWFINPFVHKRGKGSVIRSRRSRIDVFPWHRFEIGNYATIEDFTTVNNGAGDVVLGNEVRIGIGSVVLGPVHIKAGTGLGQHVFVAGFNHTYKDGKKNTFAQGLDVKPTTIDEESLIGSNSVILGGVHIGKRCQIGAGSVVTKDVPDYCVAAGNPARVLRRYDFEKDEWVKVES